MLFHYKAIDKMGKRIEGNLEAKDKFALYHAIAKDGGTVVYASEASKEKNLASIIAVLSSIGTVGQHDKITFARNLSKMLEAGLPLTRGITIMEKESRGKFKKVLGDINQSLSRGNTLSESMKVYPEVFSTLFISMVRAGEESGNLSAALQNVALQMEKTYQLNRKIRGALMYPAVIICLMVAIGVLMMVYMVPTLTKTFTELKIDLPLSTRMIIYTSNILSSYFFFFILGLVAFILGLFYALRSKPGKRFLDTIFLSIPVIKVMTKEINSARTTRTLSSLMSSGVDVVVAIDVTRDILQNSYYKAVLDEVKVVVQKGDPISKVFSAHEKLYPTFVSEMVFVGEETGKIGEMLMSVAHFYEEEIDQKTKDMSSVIEPFLMIFIGVAVGFFAISMVSPIYSIGEGIQ